MEVISVNVGLPRMVRWKHMDVETGIFKSPVEGSVAVRRLNLDGDKQADLTVHGGEFKAVYGYPSEHYPFWHEQLLETELSWGNFGENLTTTGLYERELYIGDRLRIGSAVLTVTQPRLPCYKLALRFQRDDMLRRMLVSKRTGFYFAVTQEGELAAGNAIEFISRDPRQVTVTDIVEMFTGENRDPALLARAMQVEALPESWKSDLLAKSRLRAVASPK